MKNSNIHINTQHHPSSSSSSTPTSQNPPSSPTTSTATLAHEEGPPRSLPSFLPSDHEIFRVRARILDEHASALEGIYIRGPEFLGRMEC
ncbi:hypothetical protein K440DRAFT_618135 [Wilcoxina mikolae CBS 423.85]|nr:hypothetical protein K440DRAFT_618135 [Wilcoxina mikolae CBS 423.85]